MAFVGFAATKAEQTQAKCTWSLTCYSHGSRQLKMSMCWCMRVCAGVCGQLFPYRLISGSQCLSNFFSSEIKEQQRKQIGSRARGQSAGGRRRGRCGLKWEIFRQNEKWNGNCRKAIKRCRLRGKYLLAAAASLPKQTSDASQCNLFTRGASVRYICDICELVKIIETLPTTMTTTMLLIGCICSQLYMRLQIENGK